LREHGSITQKEAIREFGLTCFTARISDLRKTHNIQDKYIEVKTRQGKKTRVKRYFLVNEDAELHS
ncbi:MAG: helix-turn-helix domain-containing protein, partial [Coprobacillaceae bacterium]